MENKVKTLEERIKINELENTNKAKQETIIQLESRVKELEQKMQTPEKPENQESAEEAKSGVTEVPQSTEEPTAHVSEAIEEEPEEEVVEVTAIEDPIIAEQEEYTDNLKRQNEKKKRKFF